MLVTEITLRKNHERQLIFNIYLRNFLGYVATKEFEKMLDELTLGVTMNVLWTSCLQGYESWANQSTLMKKKKLLVCQWKMCKSIVLIDLHLIPHQCMTFHGTHVLVALCDFVGTLAKGSHVISP